MALSQAEKIHLIRAYAPVLVFHPEEKFTPMRPEAYLQASALWSEQPVQDDSKKGSWGKPIGHPATFPRSPIIPRFGISVDPAHDVEGTDDPDGDGVPEWYLGHHDQEERFPYLTSNRDRRLWLDFGGWEDSPEVTDASQNAHCNLAEIERRMREEPDLVAARDWYYADVDDLDSLENLFLSFDLTGTNLATLLPQLFNGDIWIIWYYFFYPAYDGLLKDCEQRIGGGRDGSYEGDWTALGVLVRRPNLLPWQHGTPFPSPERVYLSVRLRGVVNAVAPAVFLTHGMRPYDWDEVAKVSGTTHVKTFVARGTHNQYSQAGEQALDASTLTGIQAESHLCGAVNAVGQIVDDINAFVDDVGETAEDLAVLLGKTLAGAAIGNAIPGIGGALGALGGGIAGLAEAFASSSDEPSPPPTTGVDQGPPPEPQAYGLVLTPPDVPQPLVVNDPDPNKNEAASEIRTWVGDASEHLVDRNKQVWWRYEGAWGVRCTEDSHSLRSGIPFLDFKKALFRNFVFGKSKP